MHDAEVPPRAIQGEQEQWDRVAAAIYQRRRRELGLSHRQITDLSHGEVSISLLSLIENARQLSYQAAKLDALSRALGWTPDSIELILAGGEPVEAAEQSAPIDDRLDRLERELAALREELGLPPRQRNGGSESRSA